MLSSSYIKHGLSLAEAPTEINRNPDADLQARPFGDPHPPGTIHRAPGLAETGSDGDTVTGPHQARDSQDRFVTKREGTGGIPSPHPHRQISAPGAGSACR